MKNLKLTILIVLLFPVFLAGQVSNIPTYVYKITDKEAEKLYNEKFKNYELIQRKMLHTLVDSFFIDY